MYARIMIVLVSLLASYVYAADIAVKGDIIYTVSGEPIENGVVLIEQGKITAVGPANNVSIPEGIQTVEAAVVTPGLIDAHTVVGLAGYLNQPDDQDQLESSAAIQPELRAIDAYNTRAPLIEWLRTFGITTIHTGHGPGEIISGQTMIAKTTGDTVSEATLNPAAMIAATISDSALVHASGARKTPGTRGKVAAMLRSELVETQNYLNKRAAAESDDDKTPPARNLRYEALTQVLNKDMPLLITAHRHQDIMTALRIADEFNIDIVLDGAAEAYLLMDEIKAAGVPVILHPQMARPNGERENISFTTAATLIEAGIPTAFQSGYESYVPKTRVVLFEAAATLPYGLSFEDALTAITLTPATILGIDAQLGSIEVGKDGDLALYSGDPFEYTNQAVGTVIGGELVSDVKK